MILDEAQIRKEQPYEYFDGSHRLRRFFWNNEILFSFPPISLDEWLPDMPFLVLVLYLLRMQINENFCGSVMLHCGWLLAG
ncbi:hypothetical protein D3C71_1591770 [compost metagenome]